MSDHRAQDLVILLHSEHMIWFLCLQIAHNLISRVPDSITKLRQLAMLALGGNCLQELPDCLARANAHHLIACCLSDLARYFDWYLILCGAPVCV